MRDQLESTVRSRSRHLLALLVALVMLAAACGDDGDDEEAGTGGDAATGAEDEGSGEAVSCGDVSTGIGDSAVTIGSTAPLSGNAAAVGATQRAQEAYFDYVNEELGGVTMADGVTRQIEFIGLDDVAEAANAVTNARRLVEEDEVFMVAGSVGTAANTAIRDYLNEECVPHVFAGSGAATFGADYETYPWTVAFNPTHVSEAGAYVGYLQDTNPDAKAALLYVNIDAGTDFLEGLEQAIEGTDIELVASEVFENTEPSVDNQVDRLASSGADTFIIVTTASHASQAIRRAAELDWELESKYLTFVSNGVASVLEPAGLDNSEGLISASYLKDPSDPAWDGDEAIDLYERVVTEYGSDLDVNDSFAVWGYAMAEATVAVLERSEPTRSSAIDAALSLDGVELGSILPGIALSTGSGDHFPIEDLRLIEFNGEAWQLLDS